MSILITGWSGFVGLNVAAALLTAENGVVLLDPNYSPEGAERHLRSLPGTLAIETGDVRDGSATARIMAQHGVRQLVHGAAITAGLDREARQGRLVATSILAARSSLGGGARVRAVARRSVRYRLGLRRGPAAWDGPHRRARHGRRSPTAFTASRNTRAERTALRYVRRAGSISSSPASESCSALGNTTPACAIL